VTDMINNPPHYSMGDLGIEACDVAKALMTPSEWERHCMATALYYILRLGRKDSSAQDAAKAIWWLTWIAKGDPRQRA
jgi:phage gp36-like protein